MLGYLALIKFSLVVCVGLLVQEKNSDLNFNWEWRFLPLELSIFPVIRLDTHKQSETHYVST